MLALPCLVHLSPREPLYLLTQVLTPSPLTSRRFCPSLQTYEVALPVTTVTPVWCEQWVFLSPYFV